MWLLQTSNDYWIYLAISTYLGITVYWTHNYLQREFSLYMFFLHICIYFGNE